MYEFEYLRSSQIGWPKYTAFFRCWRLLFMLAQLKYCIYFSLYVVWPTFAVLTFLRAKLNKSHPFVEKQINTRQNKNENRLECSKFMLEFSSGSNSTLLCYSFILAPRVHSQDPGLCEQFPQFSFLFFFFDLSLNDLSFE